MNRLPKLFCREPPPKWLVDMDPHRNNVHQRVPKENSDQSLNLVEGRVFGALLTSAMGSPPNFAAAKGQPQLEVPAESPK